MSNTAAEPAAPAYRSDPRLDPACRKAAEGYLAASRGLQDKSLWGLRMFTALNIFYWHLDAFSDDEDPRSGFIRVFETGASLLENAMNETLCGDHFPIGAAPATDSSGFEDRISGLFGDLWVGLTDEIYFDQSRDFTRRRLEINGVDPEALFGNKVVVDAGCGSGKYSAAIAHFGASQVIGIDIGEKGLAFARKQAAKVPYGERLEYRHGSLLDIPLPDSSVDMVWSNGVVHHTLDYEKCLAEIARILKPGGELFLYVDGPSGLFELMCDTFVAAHADLPRALFQHYLTLLGINPGRVYWIMDCLYAPYERKTPGELEALLSKTGFTDLRHLPRGIEIDSNELVARDLPYAEIKYGNGMLKYLARRAK